MGEDEVGNALEEAAAARRRKAAAEHAASPRGLAERVLGSAVHPAALDRLFELWPEASVRVGHYTAASGLDHKTPLKVTFVELEPIAWEDAESCSASDRVQFTGDARCRLDTDNYDRRFGIDLAFRRALRQVGKQEKHKALMDPARKRLAQLEAVASAPVDPDAIPTVLDVGGKPLVVGSKVDGGNGVEGEVVRISTISDEEGGSPTVYVAWPGQEGLPEEWSTCPRNYRQEGPSGPYVWACDDAEVVG